MTQKNRYKYVLKWFKDNAKSSTTELNYNNPFQLLMAVILSAQCTDKRVNIITPKLFEYFASPEMLAASSSDEVFEYIKSCSYPNNKSKSLVKMAQALVNKYNSTVPQEFESLITLPGVGRKTANVMLSVAFNKPAMAVDTHVFRISNRIGLTNNSKSPEETEKILVKNIPKKILSDAHHWFIFHGRYTCTARKPKCDICGIKPLCKYFLQNKIM